MSDLPVYLDNNATTPLDPRVLEAMLPYFKGTFGNPASRSHAFGWQAEKACDLARRQVGELIGSSAREILFTSGATEADNLALKGVMRHYKEKGDHLITCQTEHKAVLDTCRALEEEGFRVTYLEPDSEGRVSAQQVQDSLEKGTVLVALMSANNEIGAMHPLAEIGAVTREAGVLFFTDAAQAAGKVRLDVEEMNIDLLALTGHKFYGPKGAGALYVRRRNPCVRLDALMHGGGHERGMRSGTLNVPGIVGLGEACRLAREELDEETAALLGMRDRFEAEIMKALDHVTVNGSVEHRVPGVTNLSFRYAEGESLMMGLKEIAVSSGSACSSANLRPSHVLKAIGLSDDDAHSSLRFSFGRFNTQEDVDVALEAVTSTVNRLRDLSPRYREASGS